ncbi:MAG TPA: malto-oligosyltrehalose synthase [Candidatus Aquilonibacter sp.]|nr:malto-oligosyltrehalose synthase [Candidatus Aquilonibacter sp.]
MAVAIMNPRFQTPRATYRLQLNHGFTFNQARAIVPYLSALGISHCYVSPCLKARPGSMHGYDIVDHNSLNPEIGTPQDFDRFVAALHERNMGLILDIVPNHMGVMGSDNAWWLDVLENGESSAYAPFFDIDWHPLKEELHGKVLIPVLHDHYGAVLESGELKLVFHPQRGEFDIVYRNNRFPVNPREYPRILRRSEAALVSNMSSNMPSSMGEQNPDLLEFQSLITAFRHLPRRYEASNERIVERNRDKEINKRRLAELCARSSEIAQAIFQAVDSVNGDPADPSSFDELHELIKAQAYRLANWRVASDDINYRRFFDTNDLAALCMENEQVFQATHRLILDFVAQGKVDGLRVDHPDGLYDPAQYFRRLQCAIAKQTPNRDCAPYVIVEKILTGDERLREEWPVCGTTGYDFSNLVNGLFVDPANAGRMERIYESFIGNEVDFEDLAYRSRRLIVRTALVSELNVLANRLARIALSKRRTCDFTLNNLRDALTQVVASFPVYRTYVSSSRVSESDARYISIAIDQAKRRSPAADTSVFDFIRDVLLTRIAEGQDESYRKAVTTFAMKFQQFTSPVMAKGLEDTAFYRYNRLISLNEVGGDLRRFGTTAARFHAANEERLGNWPHTMLATSTHDSKRSEDVRTRIDILSEIPAHWKFRLRDWRKMNRHHKPLVNGAPAPSANDEYSLYQTLIGAWPLEALNTEEDWKTFLDRIQKYMLKAIREAKENTSWINQNTEYENAVASFVTVLLNPADNQFLDNFLPFQQRVARAALWSSLSQTLLKLMCPGVPDFYQGNELWDLSLADPDNRRQVDYDRRKHLLDRVRKLGSAPDVASIRCMLDKPESGALKLYVISKALCLRKQDPDLFEKGGYLPLKIEGAHANHLVAFIRTANQRSLLVIVPRLIASLLGDSIVPPIGPDIWKDTMVHLPDSASFRTSRNVFTDEVLDDFQSGSTIAVPELLGHFPVGLWEVNSR